MCGQCLENVDQTHLVLVAQLVLQKRLSFKLDLLFAASTIRLQPDFTNVSFDPFRHNANFAPKRLLLKDNVSGVGLQSGN